MKIIWTKGLDSDYVKEVRTDFKSCLITRKRLKQIAEEKIESSVRDSRSKVNYESVNWSYLQADSRGYERALQEIISLLSEK